MRYYLNKYILLFFAFTLFTFSGHTKISTAKTTIKPLLSCSCPVVNDGVPIPFGVFTPADGSQRYCKRPGDIKPAECPEGMAILDKDLPYKLTLDDYQRKIFEITDPNADICWDNRGRLGELGTNHNPAKVKSCPQGYTLHSKPDEDDCKTQDVYVEPVCVLVY